MRVEGGSYWKDFMLNRQILEGERRCLQKQQKVFCLLMQKSVVSVQVS